MGCGSSTQIGSTDNPTSADEHDENGTHAGTNSVDGQVVDVEGESSGNLLDKSPLPPIKGGDKDSPHPLEEDSKDGVLRPKTSNPNHRSPRRLPKLTGPVVTLPQVEDMNEDSSEEVDTTERGVGTSSNVDNVSIRSLNTLNPGNGSDEKADDDLDVVATPAISAKGSKTSVRSAQPTPVPPSSENGSKLSLKAAVEEEGVIENNESAQPSRRSSMHSTKKSTLSLRKSSSHSLLKSSTSSRRGSTTSKQETSSHQDESAEVPEVGTGSRRGSTEEELDEPTATADDPTDSGTEVEGTPPEKEGSEDGDEQAIGSEQGDDEEANEKSEGENEPEDEGIHEESEDKPTETADETATELPDAQPEFDNETPMTANDLGTADPSRSNSALQVS